MTTTTAKKPTPTQQAALARLANQGPLRESGIPGGTLRVLLTRGWAAVRPAPQAGPFARRVYLTDAGREALEGR
jgi:hypothetical protein